MLPGGQSIASSTDAITRKKLLNTKPGKTGCITTFRGISFGIMDGVVVSLLFFRVFYISIQCSLGRVSPRSLSHF